MFLVCTLSNSYIQQIIIPSLHNFNPASDDEMGWIPASYYNYACGLAVLLVIIILLYCFGIIVTGIFTFMAFVYKTVHEIVNKRKKP